MYENIETRELIFQTIKRHNRAIKLRETRYCVKFLDEYYRDHMMIELRKRGVDIDYTTLGYLQQRCSVCGIKKPFKDFHKHKRRLTGYRKVCKNCRRNYYAKNNNS